MNKFNENEVPMSYVIGRISYRYEKERIKMKYIFFITALPICIYLQYKKRKNKL